MSAVATSITEDEASLYDRQIRLWGLEAQNRMRSSTILILTLRALAQETIKNLVLAGVGRLIVMDDQKVSEVDLGAGLLFREEDGDVGKMRVEAALPQIKSLNPLVTITPLPTLSPFISSSTSTSQETIEDFLKREKVDLVCGTDLDRSTLERINSACRATRTSFYGAGSYGYIGYIFADLGSSFEYVSSSNDGKQTKRCADYAPFCEAFTKEGNNPFKGLKRNETREKLPALVLGVLSVWEYQARHGALPTSEDATEELMAIAEAKRVELGINEKALAVVPPDMITYVIINLKSHLATTAPAEFAPSAAILGGLLAQDILRALSRKEKPVMGLCVVDCMAGTGAVSRWGVTERDL
ncbi:hypothetical protein NliqN6_5833 [Naganishia liquefaciens]|uniref:Ubiquitin-like 1-activating enzyme E1A n=1 Tax=Naganishia liquefaciens TaxID=104408 RepID=A0A8H3TXJ8_9TREE|nr:hypothetical protein NliqN6_5833 [Naganishia liquefaciens]